MKLTYLGTAAAEGWPAVFCNCDHCLRAKAKGGKNLRTRSQALINNDLLIDFPSDTYAHALKNGLDLSEVKYVFFTHSHYDHCNPTDLYFRAEGVYAHKLAAPVITLYGSHLVHEQVNRSISSYPGEPYGIPFEEIEFYKPVCVGNYKITPLRAFHASPEDMIYIIESEGKTILYLHDTGLLYDDVMNYLVENKIKADLVSYDCTFVTLPSSGGHMGLDSNTVLKAKLLEKGIIDEHTINVVNHFSHNGKLIYDELVPVAKELGFETSYDGMVIDF